MTTGIDCRVYVDGERLPDGSVGDDPFEPTALSGLKITWGRSTTLDQPDAASCTFNVMDLPGASSFIELFRTGIAVDVLATGVEGASTVPAMVDPGFETGPAGAAVPSVVTNAAVVYSTRHASGALAALLTPTDPARQASAGFPPANFSQNFDAWDQIPATTAGDEWSAGATVRAPAGARVTVCPVLFPNPTGAGAQFLDGAGVTLTATGGWDRIDAVPFVPAVSGHWVGVGVRVDLLPRWLDVVDRVNRTNFITNPSAEPGLANIAAISAAVVTNDATVAHSRAKSVKVVTPGAVGMEGVQFAAPAAPGLIFGPKYSFGIWVKGAVGAQLTLLARFNGSGSNQGTTNIVASGAWQFVKFDGLASAFDPITGAQIMVRTTVAAATTFWVDDGIVVMGDSVAGYFDGTTAPAGGYYYRFTGAADASTSDEYVSSSWAAQSGSWLDREVTSVDDLVVAPPAGGVPRTVSVFSGRVTDLDASFDESVGCPVVHVTAQDFTADLANVDVGDEPWNVESMKDRFLRIVALSGFDLATVIDDSIANIPVSYQDVDAQDVTGLLKDLAQSVDGVLWSAVHATTGAYLRVEDPANRAALFTLAMVNGKVVIVPRGSAAAVQDISACDVLRDPVSWQQSVADVSTRVAVEWLEQTVDDKGLPTTNSHTLTLIDAALEADHGKRRISTSTLLTTAADASDVATRILARTGSTGWRVSGFEIVDDASLETVDDEIVRMMMRLLDGTSRIGLPIRLVDLPPWSPTAPTVGVYLEGGDYAFVGGTWDLSLTVSNATAVGESTPWNSIPPAWRWVDFDPAIDWLDMVGVAAP